MEIKHPQYFGQVLLSKGFRTWFKYMFYYIEGIKFVEEALHTDLFSQFDRIYRHEDTRTNINIPPRAGKTTMAKYFLAYCWAKNPKSNFIYTSFSQDLLGDIARSFATILEHPIYKAMYDLTVQSEDIEESPVNDFWAKYLENQEGKKTAIYTSRKVVSPLGGVILFASIGSSITGFGAGVRAAKGFTGALVIDDGNKPADINSKIMREKVLTYYEETLLSRLNNPDTPIFNIQQRLHVNDLAGSLIEKYNFTTLARALVVNGICQLPSQYSDQRLAEIQVNDYMFKAQYQQSPIILGGNFFKSEWWQYYTILPKMTYRMIYADTAQKTKEANDWSVFQVWGRGIDGYIYLIDQLRGKWEAPELLTNARAFWNKHRQNNTGALRSFKIEDKVSGTGLIQTLKREGIPVEGMQRDTDKVTRAMDVAPLVKNGNIFLPENSEFLSDYLSEFSQFPNGTHDDQVDPTIDAIADMLQGDIIDYSKLV